MNYWYFPFDEDKLDESIKTGMVAAMLKIATLTMMYTTCYSFGGNLYRQKSGAGIGLRGSAALAKITMAFWDQNWSLMMTISGFKSKLFLRYIDDLRVYCYVTS